MNNELNFYNIIILSLGDEVNIFETAKRLSEVLSIDENNAVRILKKAPILLFKGISEDELKFMRPFLEDLAEFGINFKITKRQMDEIPKVNWPNKPDLSLIFKNAGAKAGKENIFTRTDQQKEQTEKAVAKKEHEFLPEPKLVYGLPVQKNVKKAVEKGSADVEIEDTITMDIECPCCGAVLKSTKAPGGNSVLIIKPAVAKNFARIKKRDEIKIKETEKQSDALKKEEISEIIERDRSVYSNNEELKSHAPVKAFSQKNVKPENHEEEVRAKEAETSKIIDFKESSIIEDLKASEIKLPVTVEQQEILSEKEDDSELKFESEFKLETIEQPIFEEKQEIQQSENAITEPDSVRFLDFDHLSRIEKSSELLQVSKSKKQAGLPEPELETSETFLDDKIDANVEEIEVPVEDDGSVVLSDKGNFEHEVDEFDYEKPDLEISDVPKQPELKFKDEFRINAIETLEEFFENQEKTVENFSAIISNDSESKENGQEAETPEEPELEPWAGKARNYVDPELILKQKRLEMLQSPTQPVPVIPAKADDRRSLFIHKKISSPKDTEIQDDSAKMLEAPRIKKAASPEKSSIPVKQKQGQGKAPKIQPKNKSHDLAKISKSAQPKKQLTNEEIIESDLILDDEPDVLEELGIDISKVKVQDTGKLKKGLKPSIENEYTFDDADEIKFENKTSSKDDVIEEGVDIELVNDELEGIIDELEKKADEAVDISGNCTVYLNKIPPKKIEEALKIMGKLGIVEEEARNMISRIVFPVQKDVNEIIAEKTLNEFKKVGIQGRIRKK